MKVIITVRSFFLVPFLVSAAAMAQTPAGGSVQQPPVQEIETSRSSKPEQRCFLRTVARDEWRIWTGPFRRSSYSSPTMKKYVVPFTLITAALIATDRKTSARLPNTTDQMVWSGRVSQIGAAYTLAGGSGAMYLIGRLTHDKHATETGWLGLQAIAHTEIIVLGVKQINNRQRPHQNGGGVGFWQGGDSFPSGHAATSFALATVLAYEYPNHIAVPITAYSVAGLVSASRVSARRHWVSDVFVGAAAGFLIGRYVYKQHHDPCLPGISTKRRRVARLIPEIEFGLNGPVLTWRL